MKNNNPFAFTDRVLVDGFFNDDFCQQNIVFVKHDDFLAIKNCEHMERKHTQLGIDYIWLRIYSKLYDYILDAFDKKDWDRYRNLMADSRYLIRISQTHNVSISMT